MEDTDPRSTRKRPRLDSGNGSLESMAMTIHSPSGGDDDRNQQTNSHIVSVSPPATPEPLRPQRSSSRVTINMKSPALPNAEAPTPNPPSTEPDTETQSPDGPISRSNFSLSQRDQTALGIPVQNNKAISISSSPSPTQSVEIEVAEVEDMDQDPATSNWRSLEEALQAPSMAEEVVQIQEQFAPVQSFPRIRRSFDPRESIDDIRIMIERGHLHDGPVLVAVKQWFDQCVINLDQITHEAFLDDRDFWEEVPMVVDALVRREAELLPDEGDGPWQCLEGFCVAFAEIALHFIQLDTTILRDYIENPDCPLDLISKTYWNPLSWILQIERTPFFKSMEKEYNPETANLLASIHDSICRPELNTFQHVSEFAKSILEVLPQWSALAPHFVHALFVAQNLVESACERTKLGGDEKLLKSQSFTETIGQVYEFFCSIDLTYQSLIAKKAAWITGDISDSILRSIGSTYSNICAFDQKLGVKIAQDLGIEYPEGTNPTDYSQILHFGWKFKVLKKYITDGRMELRVLGVDAMQQDLVSVWKSSISGNPAGVDYPITRFLVKFLRDNKVVDYIVGVDSHPQLVSRSGNIVGFLVVTGTYVDHDTDIIWNTVTESHDPRTVSEVLSMLTRTFNMHLQGSPALLYLCTKLIELPLNRFDARMVDYCEQLLSNFRVRYGERGRSDSPDYTAVDIVPLRLCVRLIREITSVQEFPPEQMSSIQKFASRHLFLLIEHGINDHDKMDLFRQCIQDISEMNEFTVGSINALVALISPFDTQDLRRLALEFDFTSLIVAELAHALDSESSGFTEPDLSRDLAPRIQLLQRIIDKVPETITADLADKLWDSLFSSKKIGDRNRSFAWDILSRCASRCGKQNPFLERCMNEYLPRVLPDDFTTDILSFAEQAVSYDIRFYDGPIIEEGDVIAVPGMDRIWHIILTAPAAEIGTKAINFAIEIYLDHLLIRKAPKSAAEATHVSLVERCVDQLRAAANKLKAFTDGTTSGEDEPMVIIPSINEAQVEELKFSRSLLFLRQLLHGLRTRPQYTPPQGSPPVLPLRNEEMRGEVVQVSYQAFNGTSQTQIRTLRTGDLSTLSELSQRLARLTGFSKFSLITGGRFLDLVTNGNRTLRELKVPSSGLLIVRKASDALEMSLRGRRQSLTLVDSEVLKHFDDLYELLSLDERLSKEIFDFLIFFPPQQRVREFVRSADIPGFEMFPLDKPYKLLYSINSLIICMREESLEAEPDQEFIYRSVRNLVTFLLSSEMSESLESHHLKLTFACSFIECLLTALTAKTTALDTSEPFVSDPPALVTCLLRFVLLGNNASQVPLAGFPLQKLISNSFAALLEASMHDRRVWDAFKESAKMDDIVLALLLHDPRLGIRQDVAGIIFALCGISPSQKQSSKVYPKESRISGKLETPTGIDIVATLWDSLTSLIPRSIDFPQTSQQFFEVALVVFQTVGNLSPEDLVYGDYLRHWGEVLLRHRSHEFVGREPVDYIVLGFAHLLKKCIELSQPKGITANTSDLMEQLFITYLFPNLSERTEQMAIDPPIPVMHTGTRQEIYNVLLLLCEDEVNCGQMLEILEDIIPPDYTYEPNWIFDRLKTIRSPEGYAGLRNLSNTCYLNSLFTQLFMNINFRKFMLQVPVTEMDPNQRLLIETKKLFAYMQNTWQKSVDTLPTVEAIRTFENEMIDINVQMDVDEFYNLLFDRWEGSIQSADHKKVFRSFYGGQLVQQIKSKECDHISERLEPFSAIQCDIKGKSGLEDSLRAYVEGEMMQGDNKYSCTSCNRHVDAVKRACLKDIPDNLIFHLKRFDFDVISMMRSKINDEFHFPERIDMTPFKVEYLSNANENIDADVFELVGVLVHSGTAESGHYYSYIKERPARNFGSWVEFNDADVSRFDPSKIPDQCFGGANDTFHNTGLGQVRFNKVWNAYMLFYQRVSSMEGAQVEYQSSLTDTPVTIPLPLELGNHIAMENELFLRTYCLLDPYHTRFILGLLQQSRKVVLSGGAKDSRLQKSAIFVALDALDQLVSRTKDAQVEPLFTELDLATEENFHAASWVLEWTANRHLGIRNLLLKCPNSVVRSGFSALLVSSLARLKDQLTDASLESVKVARYSQNYAILLETVLANLHQLWNGMYLHSRAWDDYFELILSIAKFGEFEVELILEHGFLLKCLEIIWLDKEDSKKLKCQYPNHFRLIDKGRKFSQVKLLELLYLLLTYVDWNLPPSSEPQPRTCRDGKFSMSMDEADLICPLGRHKELAFLKKIVEQQANPPVTRRILKFFIELPPSSGLLDSVCKAIEEGLTIEPSGFTVPFLEATMVFCEFAPDANKVLGLIDFAIKGIETLDEAGKEYLAFLQGLLALQNKTIGNEDGWFWCIVLERTPEWAPALLLYEERVVRNGTLELLHQLLFSKEGEELPDPHRQYYRKIGRELAQACLEKLRSLYAGRPPSQHSIDARVVESISHVVHHCMDAYYDENENEDDLEFLQQAANILATIEQMTVEVPEDFISGSDFPSDAWEDNSMMGSDSDIGLTGSP
ncbi:ubiquitin carboxyl-terminal hydrolase [Emydomyces testavorans]|uniref:Ubiquitin carboxyl-terminal hydrolase n=1 Tax=Emydomyces testavorans TaxID=2070801 RepID=A0AAF0DFU7_9EURO|nr:ubiquitin carboxyl-terminal hydrolase [Emydomyces testavorans]